MLGLVLETSTERGVFAVFNETSCLFEERLPFGIQSSHYLLPELHKKIEDKVFQLSDLSFIAVGVGPGSYTGIRVGATIAKSLAFVFPVPLIGICTLDAFVPHQEGTFAAVIDAKLGGVYLQMGEMKNGVIAPVLGPKAYPLEEAAQLLENIPIIMTPNAEKIRPKLEKLKPQNRWEWHEQYPQSERLLLLALQKMKNGKGSLDHSSLELLYMRKTQAEIERSDRS